MPRSRVTKKTGCNPRTSERVTSTCDVRMETQKQYTGAEVSQLPRSRFARRPKTLRVIDHDFPTDLRDSLIQEDYLSIDTETDGLDPRQDALRIVTICTKDNAVFIIRNPDKESQGLKLLLTDGFSTKIFHHAAFDLGFIKAGTGVDVNGPVECTKTLMKICHPELPSGLGNTLKNILGVKVNKKINHKEWKLDSLSARQKEYVSGDVLYLLPLLTELKRVARFGILRRYADIMTVIRLKVSVELEGFIDVFTYEQAKVIDTMNARTWWGTRQTMVDDVFTKGGKECSRVLLVS